MSARIITVLNFKGGMHLAGTLARPWSRLDERVQRLEQHERKP